MAENAISVDNLQKHFLSYRRREGVWGSVQDLFRRRYETVRAVDGISLQVKAGEFLGYIGPNGAGKSTSIKMLTGILRPTSGQISVLGYRPFEDRKTYTKNIGVVFGQRTQLWWDIAVIESFKLLASIYGISQQTFKERLAILDGVLNLGPTLHTPVRKLSLGERMRADLAASLIHQPKILFLDEPTVGLDVVAKDSIRSFLRHINKEFGTTILLTTHDLKEIEELCERIVVIDHGRIMYDGALETIRSLSGLERTLVIDFIGPAVRDQAADLLLGDPNLAGRIRIEREGERRIRGRFDPGKIASGELLRTVLSHCEVSDLSLHEPDIDSVIVKLYKSNDYRFQQSASEASLNGGK